MADVKITKKEGSKHAWLEMWAEWRWKQAAWVPDPQLSTRIVFPGLFDCLGPPGHLGELCRRDELGARALLGDQFNALTDSDRAWAWRSLLYGVRVAPSAALAGLENARLEAALVQVRTMYEHRMQSYKRGASAKPRIQPPVRSRRLGAKVWPFRRS